MVNHYTWLEENFKEFVRLLGLDTDRVHSGLISAHGDKAYSYRMTWELHGIPFPHGVAMFLLSYCRPYSDEVRETSDGFVDVQQWVIDNYRDGHNFHAIFSQVNPPG